MPVVVNPLRGRQERAADVGYRVHHTAVNIQRSHAWMRHLTLDQVLFFWVAFAVTATVTALPQLMG